MIEAHTNGGYDLEGVIYHQHSNKLMVELLKLFPKETPIVDLGCGHNFYVSVFNYAGYKAIGYDAVDLGSKHFIQQDITKPIFFHKELSPRNVLSLEVGEHLPIELSANYFDNLTIYRGNVVLSWAIPSQAGIGHINCQSNEWVIEQMGKRNYKLNSEKTKQLRDAVNGCHCDWFVKTLMYFEPCE